MINPSVKTINGMTVITQVIQQNDRANYPGAEALDPKSSFWETAALQKFLKGEPKVLGAIQIMTGIMKISLGIALTIVVSNDMRWISLADDIGVPIWIGILCILSGALSVACEKYQKISLLRAALVMNIISAVFAGSAVILYCIDFVIFKLSFNYRCNKTDYYDCFPVKVANVLFFSSKVILFILLILELCIAISLSDFGCKALRYRKITDTLVGFDMEHS
ncbi:membrane-spanning 4-domains subfamily A member 4A-like [Latimeria chalumnae]|uniref:membrane-spanning 4-domains subfamily A member 4A-like n=1 Tax=Latimeria chalumnae TaxID=7897 RepID=UPI00313ACF63